MGTDQATAVTTSPGRAATTTDVAQTDWIVWLDREGDGIAVQQDFAWANDSDAAYAGKNGAVVTVPLPPQAANFQYLGTFLEQYAAAMLN